MRKLTIEEVKDRVYNLCNGKIEILNEEYENSWTNLLFKCNVCGHTFLRKFNNFMNNTECPYCNGRIDWSDETIKIKGKEIYGDKYDYSKAIYKGVDEEMEVICHEKDFSGKEHGIFKVTPHAHFGTMRSGCPKCSGKHQYTTEEFIEKANFIHNNFYIYDRNKCFYIDSHTPLVITCPKHGDFLQKPNGHLSGQGCPRCKRSHGEIEISIFLQNNNIKYIEQYTPSWLKPLHIDFFLPDYNIAIEVQGQQHFKGVKYWGGEKNFIKILERDKRKKDLCDKNGLKLLYYSEYKCNFPYEVITNKQKLLEEIKK